jgi:hypothetical protein
MPYTLPTQGPIGFGGGGAYENQGPRLSHDLQGARGKWVCVFALHMTSIDKSLPITAAILNFLVTGKGINPSEKIKQLQNSVNTAYGSLSILADVDNTNYNDWLGVYIHTTSDYNFDIPAFNDLLSNLHLDTKAKLKIPIPDDICINLLGAHNVGWIKSKEFSRSTGKHKGEINVIVLLIEIIVIYLLVSYLGPTILKNIGKLLPLANIIYSSYSNMKFKEYLTSVLTALEKEITYGFAGTNLNIDAVGASVSLLKGELDGVNTTTIDTNSRLIADDAVLSAIKTEVDTINSNTVDIKNELVLTDSDIITIKRLLLIASV